MASKAKKPLAEDFCYFNRRTFFKLASGAGAIGVLGANLSGSLDGSPPLVVGAVVNGPNSPSQFDGGLGGLLTGMRRCPDGPDPYRAFTGRGSRFVDDVRAWQTAEPALDMTGAAVIAAAYQLAFG